mmetsp:Transcript_106902/g.190006  ORF Transcript_106902/g.190006 Transcript_106902/m.190006 type:complete len:393 (-) Transcript_106902:121-1299(-)
MLPVVSVLVGIFAISADAKIIRTQLRHSSLRADTARLKADYPYYHTSAEIESETARLLQACGESAKTNSSTANNVTITEVRIKTPGSNPKNRVSIVFGEHSRELISPETGLMLFKMLCGDIESKKELAVEALKSSEFQLVLNANPRSRLKVEEGDYCLRANPAGVDLNRNWDEKWTLNKHAESSDQYPGSAPFSEPETQALKSLITDFRPTTFLSVHSGTLGMYMPWAYDSQHLAVRNRSEMLSVLFQVDGDHCQCPFGAAGLEVGYDCPGTSFDWVYDHLNVPFSFAWEIYANPLQVESLKQRWTEEKDERGLLLLQENLGSEELAKLYKGHHSDFLSLAQQEAKLTTSDSCFSTFNPGTQKDFEESVDNWATSYLRMATETAKYLKRSKV